MHAGRVVRLVVVLGVFRPAIPLELKDEVLAHVERARLGQQLGVQHHALARRRVVARVVEHERVRDAELAGLAGEITHTTPNKNAVRR